MESANHCVLCDRSLVRQRQRHQLTREDLEARPGFAEYVLDHLRVEQALNNNEQWMCHRCWVAAGRHQVQQQDNINPPRASNDPPAGSGPEPQAASSTEPPIEGPSLISIDEYRRVSNTSRHCMFRDCTRRNLLRVPLFLKVKMLVENKLYNRTIGTCAHIMSIMWYLGWARHQENILLPATFLDEIILDLDKCHTNI